MARGRPPLASAEDRVSRTVQDMLMSASSARRLRLSPGGVKSLALLERSAERANPLNMIHTLAVSAIIAVIKMRVCLRDGEHDSRGAPPPPPKSRKRWGPLRYHPSRNLSTPRGGTRSLESPKQGRICARASCGGGGAVSRAAYRAKSTGAGWLGASGAFPGVNLSLTHQITTPRFRSIYPLKLAEQEGTLGPHRTCYHAKR